MSKVAQLGCIVCKQMGYPDTPCELHHIKALAIAIDKESELAWEKEIVRINFETWKTKVINQMREAKDYGVKK